MITSKPRILTFNPSHATTLESRLWTELARRSTLTQFAARNIPDLVGASTNRIAPTLRGLGEQLPLGRKILTELPPWLDEDDLLTHIDWEHRRFERPRLDGPAVAGAITLAWMVDEVITSAEPDVISTTNKIDHPCAFARAAAHYYGIPTGLIERSPIDSFWWEADGLFANSAIWRHHADQWPAISRPGPRDRLLTNPAGFRVSEASDDRITVDDQRPIVFLPFDNVLWTGWMHRHHSDWAADNANFASPQDGLDAVAEAVGARGGTVLLKSHPSCRETCCLDLPANVRLVDGALDHLIAQANLVAAFNTKVAFVSLAMQRTTVTLADNPIAASGQTVHHRDFDGVGALIAEGLARGPRAVDLDKYDRFLTWLEDDYFFSVEPDARRGLDALIDTMLATPAQPAAVEEIDPNAEDEELETDTDTRFPPPRERLRVFLDVSRLVDYRSEHSGISRLGREILSALNKRNDSEPWAVLAEPGGGWPMHAAPLFVDVLKRCDGRIVTTTEGRFRSSIPADVELTNDDFYLSTHPALPPAAETGPARRVVIVHDVLHVMRPELFPGTGNPTVLRILDSIDADTDTILVPSNQTKRDVLRLRPFSGEHIIVVPYGASPAVEADPTPRSNICAMIQREPRKNAEKLLEAVAQTLLDPRFDDHDFVGLASPGTGELIDEILTANGIDPARWCSIDVPSDAEITEALRCSAVFVFASEYEGYGLPVVEAFSHGCPVVIAPTSSLVEVAGDAAAYAVSVEPPDLAAAVATVLNDPSYGAALSKRGRQRSRSLSWDRTAANLLHALRTTAELD